MKYLESLPDGFLTSHQSNSSAELLYVVLVITVVETPEYWEMACTGTLIRADLVLTTASCLMQFESTPDPVNTVVYERPRGDSYRALKIFIHPNYFSKRKFYSDGFDFAMIFIERSDQTEFPALPRVSERIDRTTPACVMGGYGNTVRFSLSNFKLIKLNETVWTIVKCRACSKNMCTLCLHFFSYSPCQDDLGTPIICNGTIVAMYTPKIHFLTVNCLETYVAFFSYITNALDWIDAIVNLPEDKLVWIKNTWYFLLLCVVVLVSVGGIYMAVAEVMQRTIDLRDSVVEHADLWDTTSSSQSFIKPKTTPSVAETYSFMTDKTVN